MRDGKAALDLLFEGSGAAKMVMDYFVFLAALKAVQLDVPFQIHTGMGGAPMLDLRKTNPIQLRDLIGDPELTRTKFVLLHGGYPYVEEAGFLASSYPNVFIDLSEMVPYISVGIEEKIRGLLEMTPTNKILYGSDADSIPEVYWLAALETRNSLACALGRLVASGAIDEAWALDVAKQVLHENSKALYHLDR